MHMRRSVIMLHCPIMKLTYRACSTLLAVLTLCDCAGPVRHAELIARRGGLTALTLPGAGFAHSAYAREAVGAANLVLFIDGDGSPWMSGGRIIAADPTPRNPVSLDLAARTAGSVLYLGRPCYFAARSDSACEPRWWTSDRYSETVVASMAAAADRFIDGHHIQRVLLVGYSGGGTLAVLMSGRVSHVVGVVSIAGNLDPDAWAQAHHYLPLAGSLSPAVQPPLPADMPQWYLVGDRDTNVSYGMASRYLDRIPGDRIWHFGAFDHACCWVRAWPEAYSRIETLLRAAPASTPVNEIGPILLPPAPAWSLR
jgi:pimeloyl-ACP methyl ester carboxylesterase